MYCFDCKWTHKKEDIQQIFFFIFLKSVWPIKYMYKIICLLLCKNNRAKHGFADPRELIKCIFVFNFDGLFKVQHWRTHTHQPEREQEHVPINVLHFLRKILHLIFRPWNQQSVFDWTKLLCHSNILVESVKSLFYKFNNAKVFTITSN